MNIHFHRYTYIKTWQIIIFIGQSATLISVCDVHQRWLLTFQNDFMVLQIIELQNKKWIVEQYEVMESI